MRRRKIEHTTMQGTNTCVCRNCGRTYVINMPCSITMFTAILKAFSKDHANCPPPATGEALA